ncbi:unnamed protein product [Triticum turgidum subsp. durum]|uniref:CCHC-type domain-containing protein n=1 Tax=Triticum turgidum subsp. durum TaxID=4567 RepID=A0A9R1P1P9_TRITD|nr:unnamed protein product [Triticum turgidum subsp. durum]
MRVSSGQETCKRKDNHWANAKLQSNDSRDGDGDCPGARTRAAAAALISSLRSAARPACPDPAPPCRALSFPSVRLSVHSSAMAPQAPTSAAAPTSWEPPAGVLPASTTAPAPVFRAPPAGATTGTTTEAAPASLTPSDGTTTATTTEATSACLPLPSVNGAAATFLAFRKADPAVRGRLQLLRPSTTKTRASSDLSLATPTPTTPPVAAAEDDGLHGAPFVGPDLGAAPDAAVRTPQPPLAVSWASLMDNVFSIDDEDELAPLTPLAARCSSGVSDPAAAAVVAAAPEASLDQGWVKVGVRRRSASPTLALAPRPIPAWLRGRCCRCLAPGHRATVCRDPFRCSRCLENGHRACDCRNPWRSLSSLAYLVVPPVSRLGIQHCQPPTPREAQLKSTLPSVALHRGSWASLVSASASPA